MITVSLAKDTALSREQISQIALELYDPGTRWYTGMARELTEIRGTQTSISPAAVHQWQNSTNRHPPWWATSLIYKLLVRRRAELILRAARLQNWIDLLENSYLKSPANKPDKSSVV